MAIKKLRKVTPTSTPTKKLVKKPLKAPPANDVPKKRAASKDGAFAQAKAEKKRVDMERNKPFGLSIPVGGEATVYLLDKTEPWYHYEHNIGGGPGKRGRMVPCIKDSNEMCPVCAKENKEGTFVMYLTCVVPVDRYKKKDGTVVKRAYQKKLFPIKTKMSEVFKRLFEEHGTFRGLVLKLNRDGEFDPGTGNQVRVVKKLPERQIAAYAKAEGIKNLSSENRDYIVKAKIDEAFDYDQIFPKVNAAELAKMAHVSAGDGSVGNEDFEGDDFGDDDDWG